MSDHTPRVDRSGPVDLDDPLSLAVIGMAGRFPGAGSVDALWDNLRSGVESIRHFDADELAAAGVGAAELDDPSYVRAGAVLDDIEGFDAELFGISPRQAELLDPQHRIFLECCWAALEDATLAPAEEHGLVGVWAGAGFPSYLMRQVAPDGSFLTSPRRLEVILANDKDFLATRVAYHLDLEGPAVAVQSACSTSLAAVQLAGQSLLSHGCDVALAGGVTVLVPQLTGYRHQSGGVLSPDGHCRAFDAAGEGTVFGSGAGVVVLKRLADAVADGDPIRAVVRGGAMNNDGSAKVGFTAPSVDGQASVVASALSLAEVDPATIGYVEAHGTGTALGDPIEVEALNQAFGPDLEPGSIPLGSIKTNLGHLDAASGVAGLIKTVLVLEHGEIPPSLHFERPNPHVDFAGGPFRVADRLEPWPGTDDGAAPRRAGVSSFGMGGTNVHLVLEQAPTRPRPEPAPRRGRLLLLSAATETAVARRAEQLEAWLGELDAEGSGGGDQSEHAPADDVDVDVDVGILARDLAHTLRHGRRPLPWRHRAVVRAGEAPAAALARSRGRTPLRAVEATPPVVFLLPGQGSQHPAMARGLLATVPAFARRLERCAALLEPHLGFDLAALLADPAVEPDDPEVGERLRATAVAQPALFAVEWSLADLWRELGVTPRALVGHSVGELVAACLAGVFDLETGLALVAERGRLMDELMGSADKDTDPGAMVSLSLDEAAVEALLDELAADGVEGLEVAVLNGPRSTVVAGPAPAVEALEAHPSLAEPTPSGAAVRVRRLHTSRAFHTAAAEPVLEPLTRFAEDLFSDGREPRAPTIPFLCGPSGDWITDEEATDPAYWARQVRAPVRFGPGLEAVLALDEAILLEVGPGQALTGLLGGDPRLDGHPVLSSLPHPRRRHGDAGDTGLGDADGDLAHFLDAVGELWCRGVPLDPEPLDEDGAQRRRLPTYPFEHRRFWARPEATEDRASDDHGADGRPDADAATPASTPVPTADSEPAAPAAADAVEHLIDEQLRLLEAQMDLLTR